MIKRLFFCENILLILKDYTDDVEPLWQHFCSLHFKDAERDECETYYELYLVKENNYFIFVNEVFVVA